MLLPTIHVELPHSIARLTCMEESALHIGEVRIVSWMFCQDQVQYTGCVGRTRDTKDVISIWLLPPELTGNKPGPYAPLSILELGDFFPSGHDVLPFGLPRRLHSA